jgi:hypothetical protein
MVLMAERFWRVRYEEVGAPLHLPSLRDQMRRELGPGRERPITLEEICDMAVSELDFGPGELIFGPTDVAGPMAVLCAVWVRRQFGKRAPLLKVRSFAHFMAEAAGGAPFRPHDRFHRQAWRQLRGWAQPTFTPQETRAVLHVTLVLYGFIPREGR